MTNPKQHIITVANGHIDVIGSGIIDVTDLINSKQGIWVRKGYCIKATPDGRMLIVESEKLL